VVADCKRGKPKRRAKLPNRALVKELITPHIKRRRRNQCWPWTGTIGGNGYGKIGIHKKTHSAHRLAYYVAHRSMKRKLNVNHLCVNSRSCCNPAHLYQGTQRQNILDMHAQRRWVYGENHHTGKRHPYKQVIEVRKRAAAGETGASISRHLGIPLSTVYDYIRGINRNYGA
jgi:hypothetical protein